MSSEKLLAVLDMSEEEQVQWVAETFVPKYGYRINFADLAFRLRDEAKGSVGHKFWDNGKCCVANYITKVLSGVAYNQWFADTAKPIHWIIAALIAKESK